MEMDMRGLLPQVEKAVRKAAEFTAVKFTAVEKESVCNIVTSADLAIQQYLNQALCALVPGSGFFGEEGSTGLADAEYLWVVDPIDGTMNFSRGIGEFCISVALLRKDEAVLGMVYQPSKDKLFTAVLGGGAQCNGVPIHASKAAFAEGIFCTAMSLYRKEFAPQCMAVIAEAYAQCNDVRRFGSCALEICYLAEGTCDLFFEFRVFPWDYAGAYLILREAGGHICGAKGEQLRFDKATPIIAANSRENLEKLLAIVERHISEFPYQEVFR